MKQKLFLLCCGIMLNVIYAFTDYKYYTDPATNVVYKYSSNSTTAFVTESKNATGDITILSSFTVGGKTYVVTSIGSEAFKGCSGLTSVVIPESVTSIVSYAFYDCSGLSSVVIPESVRTIDYSAFGGCSGLSSLVIPESVTTIGAAAFSGVKNVHLKRNLKWLLTELVIENSSPLEDLYPTNTQFDVDDLDVDDRIGPFAGVSHLYVDGEELTDLVIPDGVTAIKHRMLSGYSGLKSVTIPDNTLYYIHHAAFRNCKNLQSVSFGNALVSIASRAFENCSNLTSINITNSVTTIGTYAFKGCISLTSIIIGNGVKSIGLETFYGCGNISSLTLPRTLTTIGKRAFYICKSLSQVDIPESLETIGKEAFYGCENLYQLNIPESTAFSYIGPNAFYGTPLLDNRPDGIYYLGKWVIATKYDETEIGVDREFIVKDGTIGIMEVPDVEVISIPGSVKYFTKERYLLNNVKRLSVDGANNLNALNIQSNILTTVILGNEVMSIGYQKFYKKDNLKTLIMGYGLRNIGQEAFRGCKSLEKVRIPNGVETIEKYAFADCTSLTTVTIPNSVTSIGNNAFYDDLALVSVNSHISIPKKLDESTFSCGGDYDSHTIYYIATLYVPRGRTTLYKNVDGWKLFASIEEKDVAYELTYVLEGNVYKSMEIQPGITITPEPDPVKDGYVFTGWRTVPATMPDHDVIVYGEFEPYTNGIDEVRQEDNSRPYTEGWYSLNGLRLPNEPQTAGIYIHNGKKVIKK